MFFIGVITNPKNELYIKNKLAKFLPVENILFITEKNIGNMKNIKFETIIMDTKIKNTIELRKIISKATYIIMNADIEMNWETINNLNLMVITYGFNNKATFTVSSIEENDIIICLQRVIFTKKGKEIEPQEYAIRMHENTEKYIIIAIEIIQLLYQ